MGPGDSKGRGNYRDLRESASRDDERAMVTVDSWGEGEGFVQGVVSCHSGLNYAVEPLGEGLVAGELWEREGCKYEYSKFHHIYNIDYNYYDDNYSADKMVHYTSFS